MNFPWQCPREMLADVLHALTSASWLRVEIIADFIRSVPEENVNHRHLCLLALCSVRDDTELSKSLTLLAEHCITAAVELSIAGAHLNLCSQFLCIHQVDRARREALAFGQHAIAAARSSGFTVSDSEQEMVLERASFMADRIESQRRLSLAIKLGHIPRRMLFVLIAELGPCSLLVVAQA